MKAFISIDDNVPRITLDLPVLPRQGERISITGIEDITPINFSVSQITHTLAMGMHGLIEQTVHIRLQLLTEEPLSLEVIWHDEAQRPNWLPEQYIICCSYLPRAGELITIFSDSDETLSITVEVMAIAHGSAYNVNQEDRAAGFGLGDLVSEIRVRRVETIEDDLLRVIARSRRN